MCSQNRSFDGMARLIFDKPIRFNKIIFQSHYVEVIDTLKARGRSETTTTSIFEDICIKVSFTKLDYVSTTKDANFVDHNLAKACWSLNGMFGLRIPKLYG